MLPTGPLTLGEDGNFYGTTMYGGVYEGTVFKMTPQGVLTTLAHFRSRPTGVRPYGGVTFGTDGSLYGTTHTGGSHGGGVVFRLDLPPTITSQPASQTAGAGTKSTFTVKAMGTKPLNYQWTKDGEDLTDGGDISGAHTGTLTLTNVSLRDAGDYTVTVANRWGSVTSSEAVLTVTTDDADEDGVPDDEDQCPDTLPRALVDGHGCSIDQLVPCEGPRPGVLWKSHGQYVAAVVKVVHRLAREGLIAKLQARQIIATAVRSNCGKKVRFSSDIRARR